MNERIFHLPDLGEGLPDAEIHEWYVKPGDTVRQDEPLVAMETAKAIVDIPAPFAGTIQLLHGKVGDIIKTGDPLVTLTTENATTSHTVAGQLPESDVLWQETPIDENQHAAVIKALPAARALAQKLGVDLSSLKGSGKDGVIIPADVERAAQNQVLTPPPVPLQGARRAMAYNMASSSAQVVAVTLMEDADVSHWATDTDITVEIIQAIASACQYEPSLNAHYDSQNQQRQLFSQVNIGLAVDTPSGLLVPVIPDVRQKKPDELRKWIETCKTQANQHRIAPGPKISSTFLLSNFGAIMGKYATPVILPPTVATLGVGRLRETIIVKNGQLECGKLLPLSLSIDHRVVTGGEAARFLKAVIQYLSNKQPLKPNK